MQQEKIWDYFQNEGLKDHKFPEARQRFMLRHLKPGQEVLNIGVGSGVLERLGLAKGVKMYSLDPSQKAIESLRKLPGIANRAQVGYAQAMPFPAEAFDAVVMSEVLEHLDDDTLTKALKETVRVLKPDGLLLASTPYKEDIGANRVVCPDCGKVFHKVGHVQAFDKERMHGLLKSHGYTVGKLYVTTFVDWQRTGIKNFVKSVTRLLLAKMGEGVADPRLVVIAIKRKEG